MFWHRASTGTPHCGNRPEHVAPDDQRVQPDDRAVGGRICRCLMICGRGVDDTALVGDLADEMLRLLRLQAVILHRHPTTHS